MNLKEAFRYQNFLQSLIEQADSILLERHNILKVTTTHLRSRVMPEATDAVIEESATSEYAGKANSVVDFLLTLLSEKEKLASAIHSAKSKLAIDMDSEVGLNQQRQKISSVLRRMVAYQNGEKIIPSGGNGYRFNSDGNQITYRCDAKQVTTIDFDRNKVRGIASSLSKKADEVSAELDKCMVNTEVDYLEPYDVNASFDEILTDFISRQTKEASA